MATENEIISRIAEAEKFIDKEYMQKLNEFPVDRIRDAERRTVLMRLFHVTKVIYDNKDNINEKLISVFNSVMPFCKSLTLIIKGSGNCADLYLGVRARMPKDAELAGGVLHDSFLGNFPGSQLERIASDGIAPVFQLARDAGCELHEGTNIAYMNVLPSLRNDNMSAFSQGLEKFIETMNGHDYICQILASPLSQATVNDRLKGFEELYSALSPFSKRTCSVGHNQGTSSTENISESISHALSSGISRATGSSEGYSHGVNESTNVGANVLLNVGTSQGTQEGWNRGTNTTDSFSKNTSDGYVTTKGIAETVTYGTTDNLTIEYREKRIENLLEKIDAHIKRLKSGASYGMWEAATYFMSTNKKTAAIAASTYKSLMLGEESGNENSFFSLFGSERENTAAAETFLQYCIPPRFVVPAFSGTQSITEAMISPSNYISGKELPLLMSFPRKSVNGIMVSEIAEFGRNVLVTGDTSDRTVQLGTVQHMGRVEQTPVNLHIDTLTSHTFVTGSTGCGKSNTVYELIENVEKFNIPFLVIEPAKGEYRDQFRKKKNINLFTTNPLMDQMLKINPFSFHPKIHVLEHMDRLIEIFNTCWEMYAAMPAILKEAIEEAYIAKGWDLLNSVYMGSGEPEFPTFLDLLKELPRVISNSQYSADLKGDYTGALVTRVNSLTNGIYGQIFCDDYEVGETTLFDECTVVDLSRVGSSETKSLLMGILVLKLTEYRMANAKRGNAALRHLTVLEEAHNILKNVGNSSGTAGNNVVAKSVEMLVNSIAEMRTYGEGFVIVDQSPTSVDIAAIKNTNTKIIMRLPEKNDCELAGHAVSLNEMQINELAKLDTGVAVVMQNNWEQPVLAKIYPAKGKEVGYVPELTFERMRQFNNAVLSEILVQYADSKEPNPEKILRIIEEFDIIPAKKKEMRRLVGKISQVMDHKFDSVLLGRTMMRLAGCEDAFKQAERRLQPAVDEHGKWKEEYTDESLSQWYYATENAMTAYVAMNEEQQKTLRQYIVHAKKFESRRVDYSILYKQLYRK